MRSELGEHERTEDHHPDHRSESEWSRSEKTVPLVARRGAVGWEGCSELVRRKRLDLNPRLPTTINLIGFAESTN